MTNTVTAFPLNMNAILGGGHPHDEPTPLDKTLGKLCLDRDDLENTVEALKADAVVYGVAHDDTRQSLTDGKAYPIIELEARDGGMAITIVDDTGCKAVINRVHILLEPYETWKSKNEKLPKAVDLIFPAEDIRRHFHAQEATQRIKKVQRLRSLFKEYEAEPVTFQKGDLVRVRHGYNTSIGLSDHIVGIVYSTDPYDPMLRDWNARATRPSFEAADMIVAAVDREGDFQLYPAIARRFELLKEEDIATFANPYDIHYRATYRKAHGLDSDTE